MLNWTILSKTVGILAHWGFQKICSTSYDRDSFGPVSGNKEFLRCAREESSERSGNLPDRALQEDILSPDSSSDQQQPPLPLPLLLLPGQGARGAPAATQPQLQALQRLRRPLRWDSPRGSCSRRSCCCQTDPEVVSYQ